MGKLDVHFLSLIENGSIQSASYLIARNGKVAAWKSMGKLDGTADRGDLQPDSIRKLASITKTFTTVALMKLVEDGKLYLDQPVCTIIEELNNPTHQDITLYHLLTHTSGILPVGGYFNEPYPNPWWGTNGMEDWIRKVLQGPLYYRPGEAYNYSSAGFLLLGEIIQRVSGVPFESFVIENIIEPLQLDRTFFDVPESLHGQVCVVDQWDVNLLKPQEDYAKLPPRSDSGLYSTLHDMWKFGQMLLNGGAWNSERILGRRTVELMTRRHLFGKPAYQWGGKLQDKPHALGFDIAADHMTSFETQGTFQLEGAGRSALFVDPTEQMVVVFFVPSVSSWVPLSVLGTKQIIWSSLM
ncbi:beta-lactamase family protein [Paenibacillus profundus]|uniref:Beta-lactamase family protein n=1 Tax=Paenibacillus profundus TaxID=1173085 RepID=A0ABS8YP52_9BACL|nr:serine hydrolase domain-containing protein [Paenibacillus profundus]MCE5173052.1 beta-lactamase family protein [Paenibacillus profundus]